MARLQLDEFMMNVRIYYPTEDEEYHMWTRARAGEPDSQAVFTSEDILVVQQAVREMPVADHLLKYTVSLVRATRPDNEESPTEVKRYCRRGASPRAVGQLLLAAKVWTLMQGRTYPIREDVQYIARPT